MADKAGCTMSKRKSAQQRKERNNKIKMMLALVFYSIINLLLFFNLVQDCILLKTWDSEGVKTYRGAYTFSVEGIGKDSTYWFTLQNGDIISTSSFNNVQDFKEKYSASKMPELVFQYSKYPIFFKLAPFWGTHTALSIYSPGDHVEYLSETQMKKTIQREAVVYLLFEIVGLLVEILYVFCAFPHKVFVKHVRRKH